MLTHMTGCRWVAAVRAALATAATALTVFALTLVLRRIDVAVPQARDAVLVLLGVALILTAGAGDVEEAQKSHAQSLDAVPMERTPWYEYDGSFRGMSG